MSYDEFTAEESAAFNQGFEAAFNGEDELFGNPYFADDQNPDLAASWSDGWRNFFEQEKELARQEHARSRITPKDPVLLQLQALPIEEIGLRIDVPVPTWHGRCYEIASKIVQAFAWTDAEAVYGLYTGPISVRCKTFEPARSSATRHGWIITREGVLVDPTAWVFEASEPRLRVLVPGSNEDFTFREQYDEGAESLAHVLCTGFPALDEADRQRIVPVSDPALLEDLKRLATQPRNAQSALQFLAQAQSLDRQLAQVGGFTLAQMSWLCRTPYSQLGTLQAGRLYAHLIELGQAAVIPHDYLARWRREVRWNLCS